MAKEGRQAAWRRLMLSFSATLSNAADNDSIIQLYEENANGGGTTFYNGPTGVALAGVPMTGARVENICDNASSPLRIQLAVATLSFRRSDMEHGDRGREEDSNWTA